MLNEFKNFIAKGNVIDLAVAVIVGGAFGKIVNSLVNDILMPVIGLLMNGVNVSGQFISLNGEKYASIEEAKRAGTGVLAYGSFMQNVIDFLIIAFVLFLIVNQVSKLKKPVSPQVVSKNST